MGNSIYGAHLPAMEAAADDMLRRVEVLRAELTVARGMDPVEHCLARIKTEESMREKCRRRGLAETEESALFEIRDAIGVRVVCGFLNDVYAIRDALAADPALTVVEEKDYIRHAKPNGYRSHHMILRTEGGYFVEVQLRTISMDTWASLEHHLKYKHALAGSEALIVAELKRCAEELASTDVSMQTLRDLIFGETEAEAP